MLRFAFKALCGGLFLATVSIGAHSNVGSPTEIVDRAHKGDRLPLVQVDVLRAPTRDLHLPDGCDALVSPLTRSQVARIAGRCVS
jgi:hypothetical protein